MAPIFEYERPTSRKFTKKDYKALRGKYDGEGLNRGMSVRVPRLMQAHYRPEQNKPESQFLYNDTGTQAFLLENFPLLHTDTHQRMKAGKWSAIIIYYFRLGYTDTRIERELYWAKGEVGYIVQQIRRRISGLSPNGKVNSPRKRGRPRKVAVLSVSETTAQMSIKKAA